MPVYGLEYLRRPELDLAAIGERLPSPLTLEGAISQDGARVFYDTFDRRLRTKGLRLVAEDGALRLCDSGDHELAAAPWPDAPERIVVEEVPPGRLRELLAPLCQIRALLPVSRIESARERAPVVDGDGKTVARLMVERSALAGPTLGGGQLQPRLWLTGVRGYDKALRRLRRVLEDELDLTLAPTPLEDEAATLAGGSPDDVTSGIDVDLSPDMPADRAAVALSLRLLAAIEANLPGALADLDTEFLHDLRVAVRRTRSLQRELKAVFPPRQLGHFRAEFRWVQQVTGPSRDLDVYLLEFEDFAAAVPASQRDDLELLRELLAERQAAERELMVEALRADRFEALLADWRAFLDALPGLPVDDRPQAPVPIGEVAARRIERVYRQMARMGERIDATRPPVALHDLRKKGKELRYLLEFFSPLFRKRVTKPMVRTLKALQDTLGRFQDREIQAAMIRSLGADLALRPGGAPALMAIGVLVERLVEQQGEARAEFAERFAAFASPAQRQIVEQTFR